MNAANALPRRSAEEQLRLEKVLRDMFEHRICFNEVLGFHVESFDPAAASLSFAMRPDLVGHYLHGRLHGGVISAALDTVGGFAATVGIGEKFCGDSAIEVAHRFGRVERFDAKTEHFVETDSVFEHVAQNFFEAHLFFCGAAGQDVGSGHGMSAN